MPFEVPREIEKQSRVSTAPPGDATHTATDVQLRKNPYLNGAKDGSSIYDVYYGGLKTMMPWRNDRRQ